MFIDIIALKNIKTLVLNFVNDDKHATSIHTSGIHKHTLILYIDLATDSMNIAVCCEK